MKKWILLAASSAIVMNAHAESFCGYKDHFHLSDTAHPGIAIVRASSDADVMLQIVGSNSFIIYDTPACHSGYAHLTVAYDNFNYCTLSIKDGPLMMHPLINASCTGMRYLGWEYDGFNSYSYSLNFD